MKPKNWDEVLKAYVAHPDYGMLQFGKFLKDKYPNGISFNDSGEGYNPSDAETEEWFSLNIGDGCSASSAIYKFRLWLKDIKNGHK